MKEELDKLLYEKQELENGAKYIAGATAHCSLLTTR